MTLDRNLFIRQLSQYLSTELNPNSTDTDLLDILNRLFIETKEMVVSEAFPEIKSLDPDLFEDPNPIFHQSFPLVDRGPSKTSGPIVFQDLYQRTPLNREEKEMIRYGCVGFAGFGGAQYVAMILARSGVGNLILADPDVFESSNANRQAFCYEQSLGKPKVEVGKEQLLSINSEMQIDAHQTQINEVNVDSIFDKANIVIDAAGDWPTRRILHDYRKRKNKPLMGITGAGWEGKYLTFMPDDPDYFDIFNFSRYTPERGFYLPAISILSSIMANDIMKLLTGRMESVIRYPHVLTVNTQRLLPVEVRDLRYIKQRHDIYDRK